MKNKKTWGLRTAIPRIVFVGIAILLQLGWLLLSVLILNEHYPLLEGISRILALVVILKINSKSSNAAFKIPWIMLIMAFPVMGLSLYGMLVMFGDLKHMGKRIQWNHFHIWGQMPKPDLILQEMNQPILPVRGICTYLQKTGGYPAYDHTDTTYFPEASDAFFSMKRDLEAATSFIFMEYFIVSADASFAELCDILVRKARQGVDVRLLYDDVGSVGSANLLVARKLSQAGIRCMAFNPAVPVLNLFMNHRDHRKIAVIDGKVGYTGGFNLADEYFGRRSLYGHWKDTGLRLEGDAVRSLTASFLEMWNACSQKHEPVEQFINVSHKMREKKGIVQPYADNPLGTERLAENVYLNLIYGARESLYMITPYLIITDEMINALGLAAKRGVDVRIITPGIPDKKMVYAVTRSYYAALINSGVRIFEYSPGFCHGKQMLCDGKLASIGTSNLDYRSLYLHFENNVLLYDTESVEQMAMDFDAIFGQCREVTEQYRGHSTVVLRIGQYILRLFAPLL